MNSSPEAAANEPPQNQALVDRHGSVALLTINYPQRKNALSDLGRQQLLDRFGELVADPEVRAIVLTGAAQNFCSGADVAAMAKRGALTLSQRRANMGLHTHRILRHIVTGPKPVVAAVEGISFGAGFALAAACDHVVAASNARFCAAQMRMGLIPDVGMIWSLKQRLGPAKAREIMMFAAEISGSEGARLGLVNQLVEPGRALEAAISTAQLLATAPPLALALLKSAFATGTDTFDATLRTELDYLPMTSASKDHAEAVRAFIEKRKPVFTGE